MIHAKSTQQKLESMLNISVISLNDNFDSISKGSQDMATEGIKKLPF